VHPARLTEWLAKFPVLGQRAPSATARACEAQDRTFRAGSILKYAAQHTMQYAWFAKKTRYATLDCVCVPRSAAVVAV